jgi:DNA polymerase delta subunit 1
LPPTFKDGIGEIHSSLETCSILSTSDSPTSILFLTTRNHNVYQMRSSVKRTPAVLKDDSENRLAMIDDADHYVAPPVKRLRGGGEGIGDYFPEPEDEDFDIQIMEDQPIMDEEALGALDSVFSDITEAQRKRWLRPLNKVTDNSQDVSFQCFDMDTIGGNPLERNPNELVEDRSRVLGSSTGQVPIIRAYGVTGDGNSVAVFIHGFTPYCYFALPAGATFDNTEDNLAKIRASLNNRLEGSSRNGKLIEYCRSVSYVTSYKSIMGYDSPHTHFFKVRVAMPTLVPTLKRIMEEGIELAGVESNENYYSGFECNVPFVLRYMIDQDIQGAGWLTLPQKAYQVRAADKKQTHCQVIDSCSVIAVSPSGVIP